MVSYSRCRFIVSWECKGSSCHFLIFYVLLTYIFYCLLMNIINQRLEGISPVWKLTFILRIPQFYNILFYVFLNFTESITTLGGKKKRKETPCRVFLFGGGCSQCIEANGNSPTRGAQPRPPPPPHQKNEMPKSAIFSNFGFCPSETFPPSIPLHT